MYHSLGYRNLDGFLVLWITPLGLINFACGEKQILELIGPHHSIGPRSPECLGQENEGQKKDRWEFLSYFRVGGVYS